MNESQSGVPNTLVAAEALIPYMEMQYDLPSPIECELIRRGFNDSYRVRAGEEQFVLRLYFNGKYYIQSEADFRFELDWLTFLRAEGIPVASSIRRKDGSLLGALDTEAGRRWCALFTHAPGEYQREFSPEEGRSLGRVTARLHLASSRFRSSHHRYHLNLDYLSKQPMRLISEFLGEQGTDDLLRFRSHVEKWERQISLLPTTPEAYGLIHGDLHRGNFHLDPQYGPTLFDFDHGGYGWRAYDLATCMGCMSEESGHAFLDEYESLRPLSSAERECIPIFQKIRPVWDIGDILAMRAAWGDSKEIGEEYKKNFERLFAGV